MTTESILSAILLYALLMVTAVIIKFICMKPREIKVKPMAGLQYPEQYIPKKDEHGDWYDMCSCETLHLSAGQFYLIPLGVSMKLPKGYEGYLLPRSSTFKHHGLLQTNGMGIIDNSYCGDNDVWRMPVYATKDTVIFEGERICQFRIMRKCTLLMFLPVYTLGGKDRGGFGSTGKF